MSVAYAYSSRSAIAHTVCDVCPFVPRSLLAISREMIIRTDWIFLLPPLPNLLELLLAASLQELLLWPEAPKAVRAELCCRE